MNKSQRNEIRRAAREIFNAPQSNVHLQAMERAMKEKQRESAAKWELAFALLWLSGVLIVAVAFVFGG